MAQVHRRSRATSAITQGQVSLCGMGVFSDVPIGSLQGTAERPLPCNAERRNRFNVGVEQQFGAKFSVQAEYFWKFTRGAYDFNTFLNTPLNFPI
jgi:hypothetical protein